VIAKPDGYIAQPTLSLSTSPTFVEPASRRATSTCAPSCSRASEVQMVPGGLTRVALKEGSLVVNSSQGGGTKDTWILEADRAPKPKARHAVAKPIVVVGAPPMLSRTADHLYWMSRYTERAENTARMLDVNYQTSLLPQSAEVAKYGWQGVLSISELLPCTTRSTTRSRPSEVMEFMVKDESNAVVDRLLPEGRARERARRARRAHHRGLGNAEHHLARSQPHAAQRRLRARPGPVLRVGQVPLAPVARRHAGHHAAGRGLLLLRLGTFLERADNTARLVDVKFHALNSEFFGAATEEDQEYDFYHWSAILRSVSASRCTARSTAT
jgi:uncharacterized alpha-E superfamily protein